MLVRFLGILRLGLASIYIGVYPNVTSSVRTSFVAIQSFPGFLEGPYNPRLEIGVEISAYLYHWTRYSGFFLSRFVGWGRPYTPYFIDLHSIRTASLNGGYGIADSGGGHVLR